MYMSDWKESYIRIVQRGAEKNMIVKPERHQKVQHSSSDNREKLDHKIHNQILAAN